MHPLAKKHITYTPLSLELPILPVLDITIVAEDNLIIVVLFFPAVVLGIGVVLLHQVALVLLGLLQLQHCLLRVLLLADHVVEVVHPLRALRLHRMRVSRPDAELLQEQPQDPQDAQHDHHQMQLVVGRGLIDVERLQHVLQDGQHPFINQIAKAPPHSNIGRKQQLSKGKTLPVEAVGGQRENHLLSTIGLHAEVVEEEGRDVQAQVGCVDEEQHLEGLGTLHAEIPLLQGWHLLLQAPTQGLGDFLQLEQLDIIAVDEANDDLLDDGDAEGDYVHSPHPLRDVVVAQQPQQVGNQKDEGKTSQDSTELRRGSSCSEVLLHVLSPLIGHSTSFVGVVGEVELRDDTQRHLHHGGISGGDGNVVCGKEGIGLHLIYLSEKVPYRPLFSAVLCLLPEIGLIVECLVVMLVVGTLGRVGRADCHDGHSLSPGNAIGLALRRKVDLFVAFIHGRILRGDFEIGDGTILCCFNAITAAQNFFLSLAVRPLGCSGHLLTTELDGLRVPAEDLLVTDAVGVDGRQRLERDG